MKSFQFVRVAAIAATAAAVAVPAAQARPAPPDPVGGVEPVRQCVVPAVQRLRLGVAKTVIFFSHCSVGKVTRVRSKLSRGRVVSQNPAAGTTLAVGARVDLVISKGGR